MNYHRPHQPPYPQRGAALAVALLMLVIITLLGVAAVRATQVELKLSQNAESRMAAVQAADSMLGYVTNTVTLPVNENLGFTACVLPSGLSTTGLAFTCTNSDINVQSAAPALQTFGYAFVRREAPAYVEVNVLREAELSAKNYDFARYSIIGGYNRAAEQRSAAEITQGTLKLHAKVAGVHYE